MGAIVYDPTIRRVGLSDVKKGGGKNFGSIIVETLEIFFFFLKFSPNQQQCNVTFAWMIDLFSYSGENNIKDIKERERETRIVEWIKI